MKLLNELERVTAVLSRYPAQWAICGGIAASIYRERARFTDDIDFAVVDSEIISASRLASEILSELNYHERHEIAVHDVAAGDRIVAKVCGRNVNDRGSIGVDFMFPAQFWVADAVRYAQHNCIDYGFARLPTITPESLLVAKLFSLTSNPERPQDLDDIQEIIKAGDVHLGWVRSQVDHHSVKLPSALRKLVEG